MTSHALFIGNDVYTDQTVSRLHCAENDASELYHLFKRDLGYGQHAHLLKAPTQEAVVDRLLAIGRQVHAGDTFLLYFAGHGLEAPDGSDQYLMLAGAVRRLLKVGGTSVPVGMLSVNTLVALTDDWVDAQRVLVFDACRTELEASRGATGLPVFGSEQVLSNIAQRDMARRRRPAAPAQAAPAAAPVPATAAAGPPVFIKACLAGQLAMELLDRKRSIFSQALDDVLQQARQAGQAVLTTTGLLQAVQARMARLGHDAGLHAPQQPWMNPGAPEVLLYRPARSAVPPSPPPRPELPRPPRPPQPEPPEPSEPTLLRSLIEDFRRQLVAGQYRAPPNDNCKQTLALMKRAGLGPAAHEDYTRQLAGAMARQESVMGREVRSGPKKAAAPDRSLPWTNQLLVGALAVMAVISGGAWLALLWPKAPQLEEPMPVVAPAASPVAAALETAASAADADASGSAPPNQPSRVEFQRQAKEAMNLPVPSRYERMEQALQVLGCTTCGEMSTIEAGVFDMGSPMSEPERSDSEAPLREGVRVERFQIGRTEVTQGSGRR